MRVLFGRPFLLKGTHLLANIGLPLSSGAGGTLECLPLGLHPAFMAQHIRVQVVGGLLEPFQGIVRFQKRLFHRGFQRQVHRNEVGKSAGMLRAVHHGPRVLTRRPANAEGHLEQG